jgi:hypothetical protein
MISASPIDKASDDNSCRGALKFSMTEMGILREVFMDADLNDRKHFLIQYFTQKGLDACSIYKMIQHLAHSIFFDPHLSLFEVRESLKRSSWPDIDLEESVFQQIKECLIIEGRKGLEYRLGDGFKDTRCRI